MLCLCFIFSSYICNTCLIKSAHCSAVFVFIIAILFGIVCMMPVTTPQVGFLWPPPASSGSHPTEWTAWTAGTSVNQGTGVSGWSSTPAATCIVSEKQLSSWLTVQVFMYYFLVFFFFMPRDQALHLDVLNYRMTKYFYVFDLVLSSFLFSWNKQICTILLYSSKSFFTSWDWASVWSCKTNNLTEPMQWQTQRCRWRQRKRRGYLLFDMNLWQPLQLGGMFGYICAQQKAKRTLL